MLQSNTIRLHRIVDDIKSLDTGVGLGQDWEKEQFREAIEALNRVIRLRETTNQSRI